MSWRRNFHLGHAFRIRAGRLDSLVWTPASSMTQRSASTGASGSLGDGACRFGGCSNAWTYEGARFPPIARSSPRRPSP